MVLTNSDGIYTITAGEALTKGLRVKLSSGKVVKAGLNEEHIGITLGNAEADYPVTIALRNKPGTVGIQCASTCSLHAVLYSAAAGQVDDASSSAGLRMYVAMEACLDANAVIECMPVPPTNVV